MNQNKNQKIIWPTSVKIVVIALSAFVVWIFNKPYITPILLGFITAVLTYPIYKKINRQLETVTEKRFKIKKSFKSVSGWTTIFATTAIITVLGILVWSRLYEELAAITSSASNFIKNLPDNKRVLDWFSNIGINKETVVEAGKNIDNWIENFRDRSALLTRENLLQLLDIGKQAIDIFIGFIVYLLAWFYAMTYGPNWLKGIADLTPLTYQETDHIQNKLKLGIRNVIYANIVSGIIHSAITALLLIVFNIDNIWTITIITFLIGVLPLSPSELGYITPLILIFNKNPFVAILLIPIIEIIIIWTSYIFLPKVVAAGDEGNPLLILTSMITGVYIFGIMGFIIAPIIMILVESLWKILAKRIKEEKENDYST